MKARLSAVIEGQDETRKCFQRYARTIVQLALVEDIGHGDITSKNLIPAEARITARLVAKGDGVICGMNLAYEVFKALDSKVIFHVLIKDGMRVSKGDVVAEVYGLARVLLSGERVAVNLLSFLSGIATQTRLYVDKIKPYKTGIYDTRKTTPLLRRLERYAVRTGGGVNHRFNLNDMAMIKDNHYTACDGRSMTQIIARLKARINKKKIVVEVDTLNQLQEMLLSKADIILLDNMNPQQIARAVRMRDKAAPHILLEASGGITLRNVRKYAAAGVDRISVGALTHSRQVLDISMEFVPDENV
ncbi:MAG: carboxylating nicotinate-nucleotide diphosphorylase [Candidatus Omnitrophica bacterium]|nr:carboxylating nicotinate-nucleotide diphosphorylase [Candidatus Omnitrophota bacterium]